MKNKYNCLYVDVKNSNAKFIYLFKGDMKEKLGIDSPITIVTRKIGSLYYDIICDDEGLFKVEEDGTIVASAVCENAEEILAGNLLIIKNEDLDYFDEVDIHNITSNVLTLSEEVRVGYDTSVGHLTMKFKEDSSFVTYRV